MSQIEDLRAHLLAARLQMEDALEHAETGCVPDEIVHQLNRLLHDASMAEAKVATIAQS